MARTILTTVATRLATSLLLSLYLGAVLAAPPVVSTVPVDPNDPILPHDLISGKPTTLKGAVDEASVGATWTWDPGDGSPSVSGTVNASPTSFAQTDDVGFTPYYAIWIQHTYLGQDGDIILATLTVDNGTDAPVSAVYRTEIRDKTLPVEVNTAIDEALWFMHRNQFRFNGAVTQANGSTTGGAVPMGKWDFPQTGGTAAGQTTGTAAAVNAFEANGYLESGPASSPYTETVERGLKYVIATLIAQAISPQSFGRPAGLPDDPDANGNGLGITVNGYQSPYQLGMAMDAIVATGTPGKLAVTGSANVLGSSYSVLVQDMADWYAMAQGDNIVRSGWHYGPWNNTTGNIDNSVSGWAAIGLLAAEDVFGTTVPNWVKVRNESGLELTDTESNTANSDGQHGYTNSPGPVWGPFGTTGAALVQMAMDDIQSTTSATPDERWIRAENFFRRHFSQGLSGNNFRNYYYAMFNFAKAMRTAVPSEVVIIGTNNSVGCGPNGGNVGCGPALAPLDWYSDPVIGLARTVVDYQITTGVNIGLFTDRPGNSQGSHQDEHNTSWATQILTRTLFQAGPVARAAANPNPGAANVPIAFDASASFHQDPARSLVNYEWDFDNDGVFDASGIFATSNFPCATLPIPCSYPVTLRVTDNNVPARFDEDLVIVEITVPPRPPTAVAGGPYLACANEEFLVDGSDSFDVDEGTSETGDPPFDTVTGYAWELDGISPFDFDEASGANPTVNFPVPGVRDIGLRVADNTALAFPVAQSPNLVDVDFTRVDVADCACMGPITVRSKPGKNQLVWSPVAGAASYDVYRSTEGAVRGLSIHKSNIVTSYATFLDKGLTNGQTYWYRVTPIDADGMKICDSSLAAFGTPQTSRRARPSLAVVPDVSGITESEAANALADELLSLGQTTLAPSETVAEGLVISQVPSVGSRVREGTFISIVVSTGPVRVEVPDVIGLPQADAQTTITGVGLVVGAVTTQNSDTVATGEVISQDPFGGLLVTLGSAVDLLVSLGPQTTAVPDVVGLAQSTAESAITAAALTVGAVTTQNSAAVPAGDVISQDPNGGTVVVLATPVDIVVSLGQVTFPAPNLVGLSGADAQAAIVAAGFVVGDITEQFSTTVTQGDVINQIPGVGSVLLPGATISLVISLGAQQVQVPDVVSLPQAQAEAAIIVGELAVGVVTTQNSLTVPAGAVISQAPVAGTTVDAASPVNIVVSLGPRQVQVPDVVGLPQVDADAAIVAADLVVGTITDANSLTVPVGSVISQNPAAGATIDEASAVALVISLGPAQVTVPDVAGQTQADAEAAIVAAGLAVGTITGANSSTVPAGIVISQELTAGETVDEASTVNLVVSLGPAQVTVPGVVGQMQAAAESTIITAGLTVGAVTTINSDTIPAGEVISQDPVGGTTVDEGSAVNLTVSLGAADVEVPDVVGLAQAAAEAAILAADLTVGVVLTEPSFTVPAGEVISQDPAGGLFAALGAAVNLVVSDGAPPDAEDPNLTAALNNAPALYDENEDVLVSITATDNSGFVDVTFTLDGGASQAATLPITTIATTSFAPGSNHQIIVTATDPASNTVTETLNFAIRDPGDVTPPIAILSTPADLAEITAPTDLIGTASDSNLKRYQLGLRRENSNTFTIFAEGTANVTSDTLAVLDPTMLENGIYKVRLVVEDFNGQTAIDEQTYSINGDAKPGIYQIGFTDLAVPVTGIPIAIERIYDNRVKSSEDFGFGWTMNIRQGSYESNRIPGLGWQIRPSSGFFSLPCQSVQETRSHLTEVRLSDREWFQFKLRVTSNGSLGGGCDVTVGFAFLDGSTPGATLTPLDGTSAFYFNGTDEVVNFDPGSPDFLKPINPQRVRLTTIDGRKYDLDANFGGITRLEDPDGNTMTISNAGLTHSSGKGISFVRDGANRITQITDPRGNTLDYAYDVNGDLVSFFDQAGNETTFEYDGKHNLLVITDPLGNRSNTNEYDADGRLIATTDANGNRVVFAHDLVGREEIITNARGAITRLVYDANGNITAHEQTVTIDGVPVVATTTYEYDADDNETVIVGPDGKRTEQSFNAIGLPLTRVVDPGGLNITETFTYSGSGDVLTDVDPNGLTQTYAYDGSGNPTIWEDRDGFVVTLTYDSKGQLTGKSDAAGNTRSVSYSSDGQATEEIDSLGNRTNYSYDAKGNRTSETAFRTINGVLTALTTTFDYDKLDNVTRIQDPAGNVTIHEYNAIGKRSATIDPLGRRMEFFYDSVGALILTRFPDGTSESQAYDSSGNVVSRTDRAGRTMQFEFDELNRLVRTINTDGTDFRTIFTPGGRIAATIDASGNRRETDYDAAGRVIAVRLPSVQDVSTGTLISPMIQYEYDVGGRQTAIIDAAGSRTEFIYDVPGNRVTIRHPDATEQIYAYDQLSRLIASTDEEGRITQYGYEGESRDRLISVELPSFDGVAAGAITQYSYDEIDNRVSQTDALGRITVLKYDELSRLTEVTIPAGESSSMAYDAVGNLVTQTDYDGTSVTYEYDSMNRLSRKNIPDGSTVDYRYTPTGQRQEVEDNRGITTYAYDVRDRLVSISQPDTGEIQYEYDLIGNTVKMTSPNGVVDYTYDALNRLIALATDGEVIAYGYDAAGRLTRITTPNDIVADYAFDNRGRPTSIVYKNGIGNTVESYSYNYTPAGRAERVEESDGSVMTYAYDGMGRLTDEQRTGSGTFVRAHEYDLVGNRTSTVVDGVTTNFTYDVNDQLLSANTTNFTYDANGNMVQRSGPGGTVDYAWTPENRLAEVNDGVNVTMFGYDADGTRVSKQSGADATRFLIDFQNPTGFSQVVEETDGSGVLLSEFQYGPKPAAATVGGNRVFYHDDALSDTRLLTDSTGSVTDSYDYSAYGELAGSTGTTGQPYQYKGQQFDPAAGSYYLRQRYYDPDIGRFLSRDSFMGDQKQPLSLNPYLYGNSDPVSFYDPSGNFSLISISFASAIQGTLRAINVGQKATVVCRIKGKIKLFRWVWLLRSLGGLVGTSFDVTGALTGPAAAVGSIKFLDIKVRPPPPITKGDLEEVSGVFKASTGGKFEIELAGKFKDQVEVKGKATFEPGKGWTLGAEAEKEWDIGTFKYCNFITLGTLKLGILVEGAVNTATGKYGGAVKGEWKLKAFGFAEAKFLAFPPIGNL